MQSLCHAARNAHYQAVARGFAGNRRGLRHAPRAMRFDAAKHMDGATQHLARARLGRARGAPAAFISRGSPGLARDRARMANAWRGTCDDRLEVIEATSLR
jgi:hypothetical protein